MKRLTIKSTFLASSMTFMAVSVRVVRPMVSRKVLWVEVEVERRGREVV